MTFQNILVPRHTAEFAVPVAARLAESSHGSLRIMSALPAIADLVVVTRSGREELEGFWLDQDTEDLIQHQDVPVLLLGPQDEGLSTVPCCLRSILVALDLSADAEAILEPVIALANLSDGHVTLAHVIEPATEPKLLAERRSQAQRQLDRVADHLRF